MSVRFAAVIPMLDEAEAIGAVIRDVLEAGACCVMAVDGGSLDNSQAVAAAAGALVVDEPRRGYGRACLTGAAAAMTSSHRHDAVVFLDGDGSCTGDDVALLAGSLDGSDVVLGRRHGRDIDAGAMPWHARLGNVAVALAISLRTGRRVHDLSPAKAIRVDALERLGLDDPGYGWTVQFVARALSDRTLRVDERPVRFRQRQGGRSKVSGSTRASLAAGRAMVEGAIRETRPRPVITLMAKAPGDGHAKTRLAAGLGTDRTAELWSVILADVAANVLTATSRTRSIPVVMLPRAEDGPAVRAIAGPRWSPLVQHRAGLAAALVETFLVAFDRGTDRAVAVAGDVPDLPPDEIVEAVERLDGGRASAVLGPSADGGFNLVGLRWPGAPRWWPRPLRRRRRARLAERLWTVFSRELGGESARAATLRGLETAGWNVTTLRAWPDIDTLDDVVALVARLGIRPATAPRTSAWLRENPGLGHASDRLARHGASLSRPTACSWPPRVR